MLRLVVFGAVGKPNVGRAAVGNAPRPPSVLAGFLVLPVLFLGGAPPIFFVAIIELLPHRESDPVRLQSIVGACQ